MFDNLKSKIKEIAVAAVVFAEEQVCGKKKKKKKEMAVQYIVSRIPVIQPFKTLIAMLLSSFIDDAVEFAVQYMKSVKEEV